MKTSTQFISAMLLIAATGIFAISGGREQTATAQSGRPEGITFSASDPVTPSVSPPVTSLPVGIPQVVNREINPLRNPAQFEEDMGQKGTHTRLQDSLAPLNDLSTGETPGLLFDFEGMGDFNQYTPPDTVGDVGLNHYVQMVNVSFAIYDKSGNLLSGPHPYNSLFTGAGGVCETNNDGDPIALYDELADRWILIQFADIFGSMTMCIAVSTGPSPLGTFYRYQFSMPDIPDYMKFGVWPDGYYMGTNSGFPNAYYAHVFDRNKMLAGLAATAQSFGGYPNFLMPSDVDGPTPPPTGAPNYFYTFLKSGYPNHPPGVDRIEIYEFDVDWTTPANSTFTNTDTIPIAPFNYTVCGFFVQNCIPQPGTAQKIDSLSYWPMFRLQYRNFDIRETLVGNFTVDVDGTDKAAIRWFELRNSPSGWELYQEGTLAPDSDHRWMGSAAMDGSGNIALGYSVASTTTKPAIRYATRLDSDPLGTFQSEASVIEGGGVQTGAVRWGDYSAMNVDPADQCTFWYTTEYHDQNDAGFSWNTRIAVFKEPTCSGFLGPNFSLAVTPDDQSVCAPNDAVFNVNLTSILGFSNPVTLADYGKPAGTTSSFDNNPVVPTGGSTYTISNTGAATPGSYEIDIVGVSVTATHTATIGLGVNNAVPGAPTLVSPANGATNQPYVPSFSWNAASQAGTYDLEIATDSNFTNVVYNATVSGTSHTAGAALNPATTYYWRVSADNACGAGNNSSAFWFTVKAVPPILLVEDDGADTISRPYYTAALDALGFPYDIWDASNGVEPTALDLEYYQAVIWFTGELFGGGAGPSSGTETALAGWLDNGGCFFISSQDWHYDTGLTMLMTDYLGVASITDDNGDYSSVTGQGIFTDLGPYPLTYPFQDYSDPITPGNGGAPAMRGNNNKIGGVYRQTTDFKTTFWAFPWEALSAAGRSTTMETFVNWCDITINEPLNYIFLPLITNEP
jgi:hypothetical protein